MQISRRKNLKKELANNKRIKDCAHAFSVTGDETRLKICYLLCHYPELSVGEIAQALGAPISTVSHSLSKLKGAEVVQSRRDSRSIFYSLQKNSLTKSIRNQLLTQKKQPTNTCISVQI